MRFARTSNLVTYSHNKRYLVIKPALLPQLETQFHDTDGSSALQLIINLSFNSSNVHPNRFRFHFCTRFSHNNFIDTFVTLIRGIKIFRLQLGDSHNHELLIKRRKRDVCNLKSSIALNNELSDNYLSKRDFTTIAINLDRDKQICIQVVNVRCNCPRLHASFLFANRWQMRFSSLRWVWNSRHRLCSTRILMST